MSKNETKRCGFVAIMGLPNAGKSSLLNAMMGHKVSIVSPKVQTTRMNMRGIMVHQNTQVIFVDTAGILKPKKRLHKAMMKAAWQGGSDADLILCVVDAAKANPMAGMDDLMARLRDMAQPKWLVLNKTDKVKPKDKLLPLMEKIQSEGLFDKILFSSAMNGDGLDAIKNELVEAMPEGVWLYPEDQIRDAPLNMLASEITREQLFLQLGQELPYETMVETEQAEFDEKKQSWTIHQSVLVSKESMRKIILGEKGQKIKSIGAAARQELMTMLGVKVNLFLHVKIRGDWQDKPQSYESSGLPWVK